MTAPKQDKQELFIKLPKWRWRSNLEGKVHWTLDELYIHLAFCADERMFADAPFPSRRRLVALTGLTEARVRRALADHRRWVPADRLAQWEQTMIEDGRIRVTKPRQLPPDEQARKEEDALRYVRPPRERRRTGYDDDILVEEIRRRIRRRNWTALREEDPAELLTVVREVLVAVLGRPPTPVELSNARWCVLAALRRCAEEAGAVDRSAFVADVQLVARAARQSPQHVFRFVRGLVGGERRYPDRSADVRFLLWRERWAERVTAARAWSSAEAGVTNSGAGESFDAVVAELAQLDPERRMSTDVRLALDPREDVRRREALVSALYAVGDLTLSDYTAGCLVALVSSYSRPMRTAYAVAYGVDPPPDPGGPPP